MSDLISLLQHTDSDTSNTSRVGIQGERISHDFLARKGLRLVCANFKTPVGRNRRGAIITGEIDVIAYEGDVLCFIEIKTRTSEEFSSAVSAVNLRKQRQIIRTAKRYRKLFHLNDIRFRYDAMGIVLNGKRAPKIEYFRGYFNEAKFNRSRWLESPFN